jgi:hypothetical protein
LVLSIIAGALAGAGVVIAVLSFGRGRAAMPAVVGGAIAAIIGIILVLVAGPDSAREYIALVAAGVVAGGAALFLTVMRATAPRKVAARPGLGSRAAVAKALDSKEPLTLERLRVLAKDPADFGEVVAEAFRRMGYRVTPADRGAAADLVLTKEGRTAMAQARKWAREAPDLASIQAFVRSALASRCFEAYVLSPHEVSGDVLAWSHDPQGQKGLRGGMFLITGEDLAEFLEPVRSPEA